MFSLNINQKSTKKYKAGYPLLTKDALNGDCEIEEGKLVHIYADGFVGSAVLGAESKGIGWIISNEKVDKIDLEYIEKLVDKAIAIRLANKKFAILGSAEYNSNTNAVRIFNGIGDGFGGVTMDYYDKNCVITFYSKGSYKYKDLFVKALEKYELTGIYQKRRFSDVGNYIEGDDFIEGEEISPVIVKEYDLKFPIYMNEGAMVGVFLDQREVRRRITSSYSRDKTVLNTFSYTGAFSLAAAIGGATKTTSVDLAKRSFDKTRKMFEINKIDYRKHNIHVMDVFEYFKYAEKKNLKFDLVILDPPSFARSKKYSFSASKDYPSLIEKAIKITNDDGVIVASTNCANFDMKKFKKFVAEAFKNANKKYEILEQYTLPEDFTMHRTYAEGNYLKVLIIKIK